jgi:hypothetical protein
VFECIKFKEIYRYELSNKKVENEIKVTKLSAFNLNLYTAPQLKKIK